VTRPARPAARAFDVLVVGSGFGGGVAALRAAEKGYRVGVLEAGRRFGPDDLPRTNWQLRRYLFFPRLGLNGIQRLTLLRNVLVLSGAGVGGGSLVYANTLHEPLEAFWSDPAWSGIADWRRELEPYFDLARRMLGAASVPGVTPADRVVREVAARMGVGDTFRPTEVGVYFGAPGVLVGDPYFGGAGPDRRGCIHCGGCMVGCRHGAKSTVDCTYLYLAERAGAVVLPERLAIDLRPRPEGGWVVEAARPGAWARRRREAFHAEQVVLAAGALGTVRLLLAARSRGHLPRVSARLGRSVRTNAEALVGAEADGLDVDYSRGVAITSSFRPDAETVIQPVRYPAGSNAMGLLGTILVEPGGPGPRPLRFLAAAARRPVAFLRSLGVRRWSERTVILLAMQSRPTALRLALRRGRLRSSRDGDAPAPGHLPAANEAARIAAGVLGGEPGSTLNEALLGIPTTAHVLGGACIGATRESGVVDPYHRVFGHAGLHVVDGSAVPANLGANPALTITALAERALALWPNRGEADGRPEPGEPYRALDPVPPRRPAVPPGAPAALRTRGSG
jgi:cholesterol oxidase